MKFCPTCGAAFTLDQWGHEVHPGRCVPPPKAADPGGDCLHCRTSFTTGKGLLNHGRSCTADNPRPPTEKPRRNECVTCSINHSPRCVPERGPWSLDLLRSHVADTNTKALAERLHSDTATIQTAADYGLTDEQADRWAIRLNLHPAMVWPGWIDAGLSVVDRQKADGGWRHVWLHLERYQQRAAA